MKHQKIIDYIWNIIVIIAITGLAIFIPLNFLLHNSLANKAFTILQIVKIVFILDVIYNLFKNLYFFEDVSFINNYNLVKYLKGWFLVDFITVIISVYYLENVVFVWLVYIKLLKNIVFFSELKEHELKFGNILNLLFFIYWTGLFAHWISSGWLLISPETKIFSFEDRYLRALYWCVTTLTTIGYGDITPNTNAQIIYTMFVEILGVAVFGYLIANITGIVSKRDPVKQNYLQQTEKLAALVKYRKIPKELQEKIRNYYLYVRIKRLGYNEMSVLADLPKGLRNELSLCLKRDILVKIPLFADASQKFIEEIAIHLMPLIITPGEYLFKAGDEGNEMFFLVSGSLIILDRDEKNVIATLFPGDYFGEIALVNNTARTATIKSIDYCDLYTLEKKVFIKAVHKFPEIGLKIEEKIKTIIKSKDDA